MVRRSEDWNVGLAHDLRDSKVAQELLSAADERLPVQVALGKMVRAMDVKEIPAKVQMASPNVPRAINPAPQPDAGHAQSAPATVEADACPARAVELDSSVPA